MIGHEYLTTEILPLSPFLLKNLLNLLNNILANVFKEQEKRRGNNKINSQLQHQIILIYYAQRVAKFNYVFFFSFLSCKIRVLELHGLVSMMAECHRCKQLLINRVQNYNK